MDVRLLPASGGRLASSASRLAAGDRRTQDGVSGDHCAANACREDARGERRHAARTDVTADAVSYHGVLT